MKLPRTRGTPQGGVVSPILMNLFLHYVFDNWMKRKYPGCAFARYADDAVVHCRSEAQAKLVMRAIAARLEACVLGHMRGNIHFQASVNKLLSVVALVSAYCNACLRIVGCPNSVIEHNLCRFPLGIPIDDGNPRIGNQPVAIVSERVSHVTQAAGIVALAVQARIWIGAGCMCIVTALLALEVSAVAVAVIVFIVFRHETLVASPKPE